NAKPSTVASALLGTAAVAGCVAFAVACGGSKPVTAAPGGAGDPNNWPKNDGSLCDRFVHWSSNQALEVSETAGAGSIRPNIRRVYKTVGERDDRHSI